MAVLLMGCLIGCEEDITERALPTFEPGSADASGGTWRTLVLGNPADIAIAPATTTGSAEYQYEIAQIVQLQKSINDTDRVLIDQWKANGVIKWNEKARALVAKYNLPPEPDPDGTYPAPSATDPGANPKFPFANTPYASRAYAYLNVAFYDALVTCWYYKFQNNRPQPVVVSKQVQALEPYQIDLPGYPSEDAVIAQVAYRLLKVLFPLDSAALLEMAKEQKRAKQLSGIACPSDIAAGESIANAVADKVLARFHTDGMAQAAGTQVQLARLSTDALTRGTSMPWKSMETPARPPLLPFYGNVKMWMLTAEQRDSLRPSPPPTIGSPVFNTALEELRGYTAHPTAEQQRIATYWADGTGTYTPAGRWNEIACGFISQRKLSKLKTARALSLLNIALCDAGICSWDAAFYYSYPRPSQIDANIKINSLPNFPSYTSSHSTFSGAAATVLGYLFPQEAERFNAMAAEASLSRIYAGMHYRFDCEAGLQCGKNIGGFAVNLGKADGSE
ncbi:MAG TPA: phosphatase PAP2 family protein [Chitinophaga sp.]